MKNKGWTIIDWHMNNAEDLPSFRLDCIMYNKGYNTRASIEYDSYSGELKLGIFSVEEELQAYMLLRLGPDRWALIDEYLVRLQKLLVEDGWPFILPAMSSIKSFKGVIG